MVYNTDPEEAVPMSYDILIMTLTRNMITAKANDDKWKYWVYFSSTIKLLKMYFNPDLRKQIQDDYDLMVVKIKQVQENKQLNDSSKKTEIEKMRTEFADEHEMYLANGIARSGIVKVRDEGTIDFNKIELDSMTQIIRSHTGMEKAADSQGLSLSDKKEPIPNLDDIITVEEPVEEDVR